MSKIGTIVKCKTENCQNTFIKKSNNHSYCPECAERRSVESKSKEYRRRNKSLLVNRVVYKKHNCSECGGEMRMLTLACSTYECVECDEVEYKGGEGREFYD